MDFSLLFALRFGEDLHAAAEYFGVNLRTIYRWLDGSTQPPLMAKKLLENANRGYLPDYAPFRDWEIHGTVIKTPFGEADAFELEQYPAYRARYQTAQRRVEEMRRDYKSLSDEVDFLIGRLEKLKRLRARISDFY